MIKIKFCDKIIKLRKEKGLSQEEFGDKINISRQAISKWESEQSQPDIENVREISKVFNVSMEYLINNDIDSIDSTESNVKKETEKKRRKIKKILKIFLIIFIIYLFIVFIKFIRFTQLYKQIENMNENKNYYISIELNYSDKITGEKIKSIEDYNYLNGKLLNTYYDGDYDSKPTSIKFIDWNTKKAYILIYNEEIKKYVYDNISIDKEKNERNHDVYNIKATTLEYIPNTILERILDSINPMKFISIFNNIVDYRYFNGYTKFIFDDDTGQIREVVTITDREDADINFSYEWNESLINESDVEEPIYNPEIEYIKAEN